MRRGTLVLATTMIFGTWVLSQGWLARVEAAPDHPVSGMPKVMAGKWQSRDLPLSPREISILGLSDYLSRAYTPIDLDVPEAPVLLYVGYYKSQRTGATYHSPLNCLPGTGWQIRESGSASIPGERRGRIKKLVLEKEIEREIVLYWYYDRGRILSSEYSAKLFLIWDAIWKNRTDGALVRVSTPVTTTPEAASGRAFAFLSDAWPALKARLPGVPP